MCPREACRWQVGGGSTKICVGVRDITKPAKIPTLASVSVAQLLRFSRILTICIFWVIKGKKKKKQITFFIPQHCFLSLLYNNKSDRNKVK